MLLFALDASLRITAAAAAVALVLAALRVRSGSARHAAWSAVLVVMLTMPVLMSIVPEIDVPVPSRPALDFPTIVAPTVEPDVAVAPILSDAEAASAPAPSAPTASRVIERGTPTDWQRVALVAYAVIAAVLLLRILTGWLLARNMVRSASPTEIENRTPVLTSPLVAAPLTMGIWRPVIVVPACWPSWDAFTRRAVLAHENAHVARRDALVALLARINTAVFWFHPLAWWLERRIAIAAEHACDEQAVRSAPDAASYARVLLAFTDAVRARGGRVAWQGLGVNGTGLLGARIDRLLRGDVLVRMSAARRLAVVLGCTAVLMVAIACREQVVAAPLKEDPALAKEYAERVVSTERFRAAIGLTLEQVDALEARIDKSPDDWDARYQLVTYYNAGLKVPWERKVPGLRRHALWLIEHHPEHEIAAPSLSPRYDPEGFAQAKRLWNAQLSRPDSGVHRIYRAAQFFSRYDKAAAEALLLRGLALDPESTALQAYAPPKVGGYNWRDRLASLYASAIENGVSNRPDPGVLHSAFAEDAKRKLAATDDAVLLARAGAYLSRYSSDAYVKAGLPDLARTYLERALAMKPDNTIARRALAQMDARKRSERIQVMLTEGKPVPDEDRLLYLVTKMSREFSRASSLDGTRGGVPRKKEPTAEELQEASTLRASARKTADEALALANERRDSSDYGPAVMQIHQRLGLEALREGDRRLAVNHLLESVKIPQQPPEQDLSFTWLNLTNYLLHEGERESIIEFFEKLAEVSPAQRERLLEDAKAVREGRMTSSYQSVYANPLFK